MVSQNEKKWFRKCEKIVRRNSFFDSGGVTDENWSSLEICIMFDSYNDCLLYAAYRGDGSDKLSELQACLQSLLSIRKATGENERVGFLNFIVGNILERDDKNYISWVSNHFNKLDFFRLPPARP